MIDIALHLGATKNRATKEMKKVMNFEMKLVNISLSSQNSRNFSLMYTECTSSGWKKYSGVGLRLDRKFSEKRWG